MPLGLYQVRLSVQPRAGGEAELILPKVLQGLNYRFVIVKDGGEEGIVRVEEPQATLDRVEKSKDCKRLTPKQMQSLQEAYPTPRIKKKFRTRAVPTAHGGPQVAGLQFETDEQGKRIEDTFQTVRAGFYLIDVPVWVQTTGT